MKAVYLSKNMLNILFKHMCLVICINSLSISSLSQQESLMDDIGDIYSIELSSLSSSGTNFWSQDFCIGLGLHMRITVINQCTPQEIDIHTEIAYAYYDICNAPMLILSA